MGGGWETGSMVEGMLLLWWDWCWDVELIPETTILCRVIKMLFK